MRLWLTLAAVLALAACGGTPQPQDAGTPAGGHVDKLTKIDVKTGDGAEAKPGMNVQVDYTGWLYDPKAPDSHGAKFARSHDHGSPFSFALGQGQVIKGWDEGVVGMRVGGKRTLLIPADMGYGARGAGGVIPPNTSLVFDVELLGVGAP
jgi:FKBP-type peptidyl-prolyl cis-trans isomerase FkpA